MRNKKVKYKLDNAGLIYPSAKTKKWRSVHRISAILKDDVNANILQFALEDVYRRFPTFNVYLKRGFFWYYLEHTFDVMKVQEEKEKCEMFSLHKKEFLYRILYKKNEIAIETFHCISDGYGSLTFLNTILKRYFELLGKKSSTDGVVLNYKDIPSFEEKEDSFQKYADLKKFNSRIENKAYQLIGTKLEKPVYTTINIDLESLKLYLKSHNYNLSSFILAMYFKVLLINKIENKSSSSKKYNRKPIKISFPIDLRSFFPSHSLRNFCSYVNLEIKDNVKLDYDLLIQDIEKQMKIINHDFLKKNFNANVAAEHNFFVRIMPLFIKNIALTYSYNHYGEVMYTSIFSNLGKISTPDEFHDLINHYECMVGPSRLNNLCLCAVGYNDTFSLTFTSKILENNVQKAFIKELDDLNIIYQVK